MDYHIGGVADFISQSVRSAKKLNKVKTDNESCDKAEEKDARKKNKKRKTTDCEDEESIYKKRKSKNKLESENEEVITSKKSKSKKLKKLDLSNGGTADDSTKKGENLNVGSIKSKKKEESTKYFEADSSETCSSKKHNNEKLLKLKKTLIETEQERLCKKKSKSEKGQNVNKSDGVQDVNSTMSETNISKRLKSESKVMFAENTDDVEHKNYKKTPFPEKLKKKKKLSDGNDDIQGKKLIFEVLDQAKGTVETTNKNKENEVKIDGKKEMTEFEKNAARRVKAKERKSLQTEDEARRTIFVGNLPNTITKLKIIKTFSKFGKIESARLRCAAVSDPKVSKKVAVIKQEFHKDRKSINSFIKFANQESAQSALSANGMILQDHHLRVDLVHKESLDNTKAVFVGNLHLATEEEDLWTTFQDCGNIHSVRLVRHNVTSMGKGIGYVNFESAAAVELALKLDGQEVKGRPIRVKRCQNIKKKNKNRQFRQTETPKQKQKTKRNIGSDNVGVARNDYSGKQASKKKKPKHKRPGREQLKKKKIVKILTKKKLKDV